MNLFERIQETTAFIQGRVKHQPTVGIILGSGLGDLSAHIKVEAELPYDSIPHFPVATVQGHAGKLLFGNSGGKEVVMMSGRFHYYEGYDMDAVTFPVRVMQAMGVQTLIVSNAAGGMNPEFKVGDIMLITDHINLFPEHPLRGPNDDRLGLRFPDMGEPYTRTLLEKARVIAQENNISVKEGVYIGLQGPTFETPAEYRWLHVIGGDAVGMSTVPEVIVAVHGGMQVFAASIITDLGGGDQTEKITLEEVLAAAGEAAPLLAKIVTELIAVL